MFFNKCSISFLVNETRSHFFEYVDRACIRYERCEQSWVDARGVVYFKRHIWFGVLVSMVVTIILAPVLHTVTCLTSNVMVG